MEDTVHRCTRASAALTLRWGYFVRRCGSVALQEVRVWLDLLSPF